MVDEPIGISISPYGPEQDEPVGRSVSQSLLGTGWLVATTLAVAASFAKLYGFSMSADGDSPDRFVYSVDGWGRIRVSGSPSDLGFDSGGLGSGPRYGVVLCLAAAVMLFGWLIQRRWLNLPRLAPHGTAVSGLAAVFLCGVVGCQLVDAWPLIHGPAREISLGSCLYLGAGSALLGLVTWFFQRRSQQPAAADVGEVREQLPAVEA